MSREPFDEARSLTKDPNQGQTNEQKPLTTECSEEEKKWFLLPPRRSTDRCEYSATSLICIRTYFMLIIDLGTLIETNNGIRARFEHEKFRA